MSLTIRPVAARHDVPCRCYKGDGAERSCSVSSAAENRPSGAGWLYTMAIPAVMLACSKSAFDSSPLIPTRIEVAGTLTRHAAAGDTISVGVRVLAQSGRGLTGHVVHFRVDSGGGSVRENDVRTDSFGVASTEWRLGTGVGGQLLTASSDSVRGAVRFVHIAAITQAAMAASVLRMQGDSQQAAIGTTLPVSPRVRVLDRFGNPVAGQAVEFSARDTSDRLTAPERITDRQGDAVLGAWYLGVHAGPRLLSVSVGGNPLTAFVAHARPGALHSIVVVAGNHQKDTTLAQLQQPVVFVARDTFANPIPGAAVRILLAEGSVSPRTMITDDSGRAVVRWTLSATAGGQSIVAQSVERTLASVYANAEAVWPVLYAGAPTLGANHACAIATEDASVWCWGSNARYAAGADSTSLLVVASRVRLPVAATRVFAGGSHSCALDREGGAWCWGHNFSSQLGDGTQVSRPVPAPAAPGLRFKMLAAGGNHTCGIALDDRVHCWGSQGTFYTLVPLLVSPTTFFSSISAGYSSLCGIATDGVTYCFALTTIPNVGVQWRPVRVEGPSFATLTGGYGYQCGIMPIGEVFCWGDNSSGQLGNGTLTSSAAPTHVAGDERYRSVHSAYDYSCGVSTQYSILCWGGRLNNLGLPRGSPGSALSPVALPNVSSSSGSTLSMGDSNGCMNITPAVWCWGLGGYGPIGDGSRQQSIRTRLARVLRESVPAHSLSGSSSPKVPEG